MDVFKMRGEHHQHSKQHQSGKYYESSLVDSKLICPNCKIKYVDPRYLPCFHSVCYKCCLSNDQQQYKCPKCKQAHNLLNYKFPKNDFIQEFVRLKPVDIGPVQSEYDRKHEATSVSVEELNTTIKQSIDLLNKSDDIIRTYCDAIRHRINRSVESKIEDLVKVRDRFLKQANLYEMKCLENNQKKLKPDFQDSIETRLEFASNWVELADKNLSEEELNRVASSSRLLGNRLKNEYELYEAQLLFNSCRTLVERTIFMDSAEIKKHLVEEIGEK